MNTPGLNATSDERDMWLWSREQDALSLYRMHLARGEDEVAARWKAEANRLRAIRWPKDRAFQPI